MIEQTARHVVTIHRAKPGKCQVSPGVLNVQVGDLVEFQALHTDVELYFPQPGIWVDGKNLYKIFRTESLTLTTADRPGPHEYAATCRRRVIETILDKDDNRIEEVVEQVEFAEGNSSPRIIIYR
jgi:hypothetical protein